MSQKRKTPRCVVKIKGTIAAEASAVVGECILADVSEGGARITDFGSAILPDKFEVILTKNGTVRRRCQVVWRTGLEVGVRFV